MSGGQRGFWDVEERLRELSAQGDPLEAAFILRAHRSNLPRLGASGAHTGASLRLIRRISSAFKEIPGGQRLGPSTDYLQRLFRLDLLDEDPAVFRAAAAALPGVAGEAGDFPKVVDGLRAEGLLQDAGAARPAIDITREPIAFPIPRPARLAHLARGETGGVLTMAYTTMRGYGYLHPTVAELRVGWLPVMLPHPLTGEPVEAGEVLVTECQVIALYESAAKDAPPVFGLGYGVCFGRNEHKAIAAAMLDRTLQLGRERGARYPAEDEEFVLLHVDGVESMGFCNHYKLPHYVTFQSSLDRLRATRRGGVLPPEVRP